MSCLPSKNQNQPTAQGLPSRPGLALGVALFLLLFSLPVAAQNSTASEYHAMANYLANFRSFGEWAAEALPSGKAPLLVCALGDYSFGTSLAESTRRVSVQDHRLGIHRVHKSQELSARQILFVGRSEQKRYNQALDAVRGRTILTVGETPEFLDAGGVLSFSSEQGIVQFDVNLDAASKAHLKISSGLLALARRVVNQTEAAKS